MKHRIMIVDDEKNIRSSLKLLLADKYHIIEAESGKEALSLLDKVDVDLILLDIQMEDMNGIEVLEEIKEMDLDLNIIMVTVEHDVKKVVHSLKMGAYDYITKPFETSELLISIERALENKELKQKSLYLESEYDNYWKSHEIIGKSDVMIELFKTIDKVSKFDTNILITGETGVGKELVARAVHKKSIRAKKPFIAINCGAMPVNLIESELFGHEPGAFTGATSRKKGKFELAHGGIIFLDEISDLSIEAQVKLLRVLQSGEFARVGSVKTFYTDVKVFAATNQELGKLVSEGKFRKDLYYRINVVEIKIPPLRERKEDIPLLTKHFIKKYSREMNIEEKEISNEVLLKLQEVSDWDGNIRELEHKITSALILSEDNKLTLSDFLPEKREKIEYTDITSYFIKHVYDIGTSKEEFEHLRKKIKKELLRNFDKIFFERILKKVDGNVDKAVEETGINRTYFYYLLKRAGIKLKDFQN